LDDDDLLTVDVSENDLEDEAGDGTFRVTLTPVEGVINTAELGIVNDLVKKMSMIPIASQAAMMAKIVVLSKAYNTMLKSLGNGSYLPVGRSLIKFPDPRSQHPDGYSLGGGLVNWSGASVIYNFGWKPYINVDSKFNSVFLSALNTILI